MAYEHNDIVNKTRLMGELGEELMGFEHNDIVTTDVMNKAIEEGGGGGGGGTKTATLTATCTNPNVEALFVGYWFDDGNVEYTANGEIGDGVDLIIINDGNRATFGGFYNDEEVNLVLESVSGDGEIKIGGLGNKYLEIHGDCAVTLSYTP